MSGDAAPLVDDFIIARYKAVVADAMTRIRSQIAEQLTPDDIAALVKEGIVQAVADMVKAK